MSLPKKRYLCGDKILLIMDDRDKRIADLEADYLSFKETMFAYYASIQRLIKVVAIALLLGLIAGCLL